MNMSKIKEIVKGRNKTYTLVLDPMQKITVTEQTLSDYHLYAQKEISAEELKTIQGAGSIDVSLNKARNFMSYKLRTRHEVALYLQKQALGKDLVNKVIQRLTEEGHLDDEKYVSLIMDEWIHFGLNGPKLIEEKLRQKGIDPHLISKGLEGYTKALQTERLLEDLNKLTAFPVRKPYYKARQSLIQKYLRKGFDVSLIKQVFNDNSPLLKRCIDEASALRKTKQKVKQKKRTAYQIKQMLHTEGFSAEAKESFYEEEDDDS